MRRRWSSGLSRRVTAAIVAASLAWWARPASAQTGASGADRAAAQELFDEARRLEASADYAAACPKFARSQELDPAGGTLLNLAACHEKTGRLATAWAEFNEALSLALRDSRADREQFARRHIAALEPQLARVQIAVPEASLAGLDVRLDDARLARPLWGVPVPVDPGSHILSATAASRRAETVNFSVIAGEVKEVAVPPLAVVASGIGVAAIGDGGRHRSASVLRTVGFAVGGVGVVGLAVGAYFGIQAIQNWSESNDDCTGDSCRTAQGVSRASSAKSWASASNIALAGGAAAVAAGVVLVLVSEAKDRDAAPRVAARFVPSMEGARAVFEGTW